MTSIQQAQLTCLRELRRNLRSVKGLVMGVLFLLGGAGASLIYIAVSNLADKARESADLPQPAVQQIREAFWTEVWSAEVGAYLAECPSVIVALLKASLWFIPFLTLVIGFEQVSGDLQHRSMRYTVLRATRTSIVAGKAMAVWIIVSMLLLLLHAFVWIVTWLRGDGAIADILAWGPHLWVHAVFFTAAYAGLTILMSSLVRRPIICLFIGMIVFFGISVTDLAVDVAIKSKSTTFAWLKYVGYAIPDYYESWMVSPNIAKQVGAMTILLGFGALATAAAAWLMNRRDV